jgi:hypothetical protein
MGVLKRGLILPDLHAPYHNRAGFALFMKVARSFQWDYLVSIGDFYDCYSVSRYIKHPKKEWRLYEELTLAKQQCLSPLNGLGIKNRVITLGNHDTRPDTFLQEKAPEVYTQFVQDDWLGFRSTGWTVIDYKQNTTIGKALFTHEVGETGALAVLNAVQDNVVTGHDHQMNYIVRGNAKGILHVSATFGWLGDPDHASYMFSIKAKRKWAPGFGVFYVRRSGHIYLTPVPIVDETCVVEGRFFTT